MWQDLATFALGALTLGVSANLFTRRGTRAVARARALADLAAVAPPGAGRDALTAHADREIVRLVVLLQTPSAHWAIWVAWIEIAVGFPGALALLISGPPFGDELWMTFAFLGCTSIFGMGLGILSQDARTPLRSAEPSSSE